MAEDDGKELVLTKHALFGFGFSFVGGSQDALPLVIADILNGSPADLCGQLAVGDILLAVNHINVSYMTLNEVVNLICSGGERVTLKIKPGSLADLTNDGCSSFHAREESPSRQCQTRHSNNGRLKLRLKSHIDSDIVFNVRHSFSSELSSGASSVISERNKEPYSAVPLQLPTDMTDGFGNTIGKGANGGMGSDRDLNGHGSECIIVTGQVLKEPRFETFLMTGDMMIKTTKIPAVSRVRHDVEVATLENVKLPEKTESQLTSYLPNDIHSSRNEALCQSRKISRILPDVVQRDCFADILPETLSALPQSISEYDLPHQDNKLLQGIFVPPDFSNVHFELDIPPDDISSDDERFRIEERAFNMDDLPPPPDEFLTDSKLYVPSSDEGARLHSVCDQDVFKSLPVNRTVFFGQELCDGDATAVYPVVKDVITSSRSEENLSPKTLSDNQPLFFQGVSATVRGSRSQGNYLQCSPDGIIVEIDFGEQTSTSLDTLHCQNLRSSLNCLGPAHVQVGQNLHSLPKHRSPMECQNSIRFQTDIGMETSNLEIASVVGADCPISDDSITKSYFDDDIAPPESFRSSDSGIACTSSVHETDEGDGNFCAKTSKDLFRDGSFDTSVNVSDIGLDCQMLRKTNDSHESQQYIIDSAKTVSSCLNGQEQPLSGSITDETFGRISSKESEEESFHFPCKDVDRPSAQRLAQRLFCLKGFQKKDVSKHLGKKNEFAQLVGEEYLKHFDFTSQSLDTALRLFLQQLVLSGETQERERILAHFSHRYIECNPGSFNSEDACHTLTCAMLLLNTDLHIQNVGHKMTLDEFIENLADLNDGENFSRHLLQSIYCSIQNESIAVDEEELQDIEAGPKRQCFTLGSNPFLDVRDPSKATEFKTGCVMRKCCIDPDGRRTVLGKRSWKMFYASLRDMVLYLYKDEQGLRQQTQFPNLNNAVRLHHSLATLADDYKKKHHVFRLQTSDGAEFLFQTGDGKECRSWIDQINYVTAAFSSPPLPCAVGSQRKFQRPLMPCSHTRLSLVNQLHHHHTMLNQTELELAEHRQSPPDKGSKSRIIQDYLDKELYLEFEIKRFTAYCSVLESNPSKQDLLSEDQIDKSHATAFSQKQSQKSASVQRSQSDRQPSPFVRQQQQPKANGSRSRVYASMLSARSMPSIFHQGREDRSHPATTWYVEFSTSSNDDNEFTYY